MADGLLYRLITRGRLKLFRRPTMKTVLGGHPVVGADLDADRVEVDHRVEGHPEAGAATP